MKVLNKSRVSYVWFDITKRISTENSVDVLLLSHLMGKNNSTISYQDEWEYKLYIYINGDIHFVRRYVRILVYGPQYLFRELRRTGDVKRDKHEKIPAYYESFWRSLQL